MEISLVGGGGGGGEPTRIFEGFKIYMTTERDEQTGLCKQ